MEETKPYKGWYESFTEILEENPEVVNTYPDIVGLVAWEKERKERMKFTPEQMEEIDKEYEEQRKRDIEYAASVEKYQEECEAALREKGIIPAKIIKPVSHPKPEAYKRQHPIDMMANFSTGFDRSGTGRNYLIDQEGKYVKRYKLYMILHIYDRERNNQEVKHYSFSDFEEQFRYSFPQCFSVKVDPDQPDGYILFADLERIKRQFGHRYTFEAEFEKIEAVCIKPDRLDAFEREPELWKNEENLYTVEESIDNFRDAVINQYERFSYGEAQFDDCNRLYYTPEERAEIKACRNA